MSPIVSELQTLYEDVRGLNEEFDLLEARLASLMKEVYALTLDVREGNYALCGDPLCEGDCIVCQQGEEDYEDDYEEKYCRRGRR